MNKSAIITTLIVVTIILLGIWSYDYYFRKNEHSTWDLVPESAAMIYEPQMGKDVIPLIENSEIWKSFSDLKSFSAVSTSLTSLDTIVGISKIDHIVKDGGLLITINPISGSSFDFLYILEKGRDPKLVGDVLNYYLDQKDNKVSTRIYNGFTIVEFEREGKTFSYAENGSFWWGSYSAFLVEDVIRQLTEEGLISFRRANPEAFFNAKISKDAGNIYFNYDQLSRLFTSFLSPKSRGLSKEISIVGKSAFLDFEMQNESILLTGFSYYNHGGTGFLKDFEARTSGTSNIELYIPSETAYYMDYFSEPFSQIKDLPELSDFVETLNGEVAIAVLEASSFTDAEKIYFVRSDDADRSEALLTTYAESKIVEEGDTLYYEDYSGVKIVELKDPDFGTKISRYGTADSENQFFLKLNNLLIFSNSIQTLKHFLLDVDTENTWGKSVKKNGFISSTLEESSFSLMVDINKTWNFLIENLHESWRSYLGDNEEIFRNFDLMAIQFSYTEKKFFTNILISHDSENSTLLVKRSRLDPDHNVEFSSVITNKPKIVRNHTAPGLEVILQSDDNQIHMIGSNNKVRWSKQYGSKVHGEIQQIDFFDNGKLQYIFATDSAIHIIDRNGNLVEGYPIQLDYVVDKFNVIDYDRSKNYRIIASDIKGNIYLYDKGGRNLSGWNPKRLEGKLADNPFHIRVRGRDCIIALQERGRLNVLNRKGEMMPGFPIELGPGLQPTFSLSIGATFSSTVFTLISRDGLLYNIDLNGKRLNSQQLFRTSKNMRFSIVPERQDKGFVIVGKDIGQFQVFDQKGSEIFRENLISGQPFNYQYYDFGSNRKLYVITDPEQEFSYLYDKSGNLINNSPIDSKFDISVLFSEVSNTYKIYSAYENKVNIYSF